MKQLGALLIVGALLVGCGGTGDAGSTADVDVVAVVKDYQQAFLDQDGEAACAKLTGEAKRQLTVDLAATGATSCTQALDAAFELYGPEDFAQLRDSQAALAVDDVQLDGDSATVALPRGRSLRLSRIDGEWYVSDPDAS